MLRDGRAGYDIYARAEQQWARLAIKRKASFRFSIRLQFQFVRQSKETKLRTETFVRERADRCNGRKWLISALFLFMIMMKLTFLKFISFINNKLITNQIAFLLLKFGPSLTDSNDIEQQKETTIKMLIAVFRRDFCTYLVGKKRMSNVKSVELRICLSVVRKYK